MHIASIRNVRISNNGSAIVVEAERELRLETHEQGVKHQWIRALQFLQKAAHLCCPATSLSGKMPAQKNSINSGHSQQNRNQSRKFERNGNNANFKSKGGNDNRGRSFMNNNQNSSFLSSANRQNRGGNQRSSRYYDNESTGSTKYDQYKARKRMQRERKENSRPW